MERGDGTGEARVLETSGKGVESIFGLLEEEDGKRPESEAVTYSRQLRGTRNGHDYLEL